LFLGFLLLLPFVIGHCGDTTDLSYLEDLLDSGCYIGLDRFGIDMLLPMESRMQVSLDLIEKGFEDQIVFSHDYSVFIDWFPQDVLRNMKLASYNRWSFHHILVDILPLLYEKGVSKKQVDQITIENPKKILK
jgi:phosphotriesterase-related protein